MTIKTHGLGKLTEGQFKNIEDIIYACNEKNEILGFTAGRYLRMISDILATTKWETNMSLYPVEEAYWIKDDEKRKRVLINYYTTGKGRNHKKTIIVNRNGKQYVYTGKGYIQLTHLYNYEWADQVTHGTYNLVNEPDNAMKPQVAAKITAEWFFSKHLNAFKKYIPNDNSWNLKELRTIVNGYDKWDMIATFAKQIHNSLAVDLFDCDKITLLEKGKLAINKIYNLNKNLKF